ncbi:hypothetical protein EVAR_84102_1 [Eumeta japonica]|uniref:Uncharacterized protein n=1 Tax=Eumeta variegata TaxID=151549 RepID=A0A4C1V073_EUMVA|nr:hypothetical protein EVAR_84102_1 [Eumeta japonica]
MPHLHSDVLLQAPARVQAVICGEAAGRVQNSNDANFPALFFLNVRIVSGGSAMQSVGTAPAAPAAPAAPPPPAAGGRTCAIHGGRLQPSSPGCKASIGW